MSEELQDILADYKRMKRQRDDLQDVLVNILMEFKGSPDANGYVRADVHQDDINAAHSALGYVREFS